MTTCVSGGICMSRSSLRLGASEGESDALLGKGSGSRDHLRRGDVRKMGWRRRRVGSAGQFAKQAVAFDSIDSHRQYLSDDLRRRHHMRRLQVGGAADELAGIAGGSFEQHIDGVANRSPIEGRLLAVDQLLE